MEISKLSYFLSYIIFIYACCTVLFTLFFDSISLSLRIFYSVNTILELISFDKMFRNYNFKQFYRWNFKCFIAFWNISAFISYSRHRQGLIWVVLSRVLNAAWRIIFFIQKPFRKMMVHLYCEWGNPRTPEPPPCRHEPTIFARQTEPPPCIKSLRYTVQLPFLIMSLF